MNSGTPVANIADAAWFGSPDLQSILTLLNADGGQARIAGGAVRDTLMGRSVGDIDIATTLSPQEVMDRAEGAGIKSVPTGIDHGTITLVVNGKSYEVTTLRIDVVSYGRHAQVAFGADWAMDAARRDLTMNGLYADAEGNVIDLVDGFTDINSRTVRFIGDAASRIEEDYLRILRFFRFFAWYGDGRPDPDGLRASARLKAGIARLSAERVWSEFKKLLGAPDPSRALLWMRQSGILSTFLPESEKWGIDSIFGLVQAQADLKWGDDAVLRLMAIVPNDPARLDRMAKRLRLANSERKRLVQWAGQERISEDLSDIALRRLLYRGDPQAIIDKIRLQLSASRTAAQSDDKALHVAAKFSRMLKVASQWKRPSFPLSGKDLQALGISPGPAMGAALNSLEEAWVESNFALTRAQLLEKASEQVG